MTPVKRRRNGRLALGGVVVLATAIAGCVTTESTVPKISPSMVASADRGVTPASLESGRRLLASRCIGCHGLEPIKNRTPEEWDAVVVRMADRANLTPREKDEITAYLVAARRAIP